ncbi:hypothetical protein CAPTEDRAFT_53734, partial [Capitella teleta]
FSEMREAEELVDVYLVFNGKLVPCHKVILAGNCEYFKRMFLSKMNESSAREVNLKGINATHGELVVDYLYSKDIEITEDNAQGLLEASSLLMLDKLKKKVEHFLIGQLEAENCVSILNVARFYQLETLLETSLKFLCDRLHKIIDTMELEELTKDDLVNVLENHATKEACFILDMKTLEWGVLSPLHRPMCHSLVASVSNRLFVIGGTPNPTSISTGVHFIESGRLNWRPRTPAPEDCRGASAATLKNKVFVVGGASNSCMAYDTLVDAWAILERPQVLFTYKASLEWNGKILLLGGTEDD